MTKKAIRPQIEERLQGALNTKGALSKSTVKATRDLVMVTLLLHTGLRVSELVGFRLSDVEMSERKGNLTAAGKRNEQRKMPLNAHARLEANPGDLIGAGHDPRAQVAGDAAYLRSAQRRSCPTKVGRLALSKEEDGQR